MINNGMEYILCAAVRRIKPRETANGAAPYHEGMNDILGIELGYRHHDIFQRFGDEVSNSLSDQGFYTSRGRFVGRKDAMKVAAMAGQVAMALAYNSDGSIRNLYSEDLY